MCYDKRLRSVSRNQIVVLPSLPLKGGIGMNSIQLIKFIAENRGPEKANSEIGSRDKREGGWRQG